MNKFLSSKLIIPAFFLIVVLLLTLPLTFLLTTRSQASQNQIVEPTPTPAYFTPGPGIIAGYVYADENKDGERGNEEKPLQGITIQIKQLNQKETKQTTLKTDSHGYFRARFTLNPANPTSYAISVRLPANYEATNANPIIIADFRPGKDRIVEFGLFSNRPTPSITKKLNITPKITKQPTKSKPTVTVAPTTP